MLELHILRYIMSQQGSLCFTTNRLIGWSLVDLQKENDVPKSTFYRAVKELIKQGFVRQLKRDEYCLNYDFKVLCYSQQTEV